MSWLLGYFEHKRKLPKGSCTVHRLRQHLSWMMFRHELHFFVFKLQWSKVAKIRTLPVVPGQGKPPAISTALKTQPNTLHLQWREYIHTHTHTHTHHTWTHTNACTQITRAHTRTSRTQAHTSHTHITLARAHTRAHTHAHHARTHSLTNK